jgi:Ca-activated chloride channel family protein
MKPLRLLALILVLGPRLLVADAGILLPRDRQQPDPKVLSLDEMQINVSIDNGDAKVFVRQIFANHTGQIEEGNYIFALPSDATMSDFATWDGPTRLPAVILERKRAEEIYTQLKWQAVDPGQLQMGERGAEEAKRSSVFSARIVPIPAYGTKRLEIEYHETIPVENLKSYFPIPLHPDAYQSQTAHRLAINLELHSALPIRNFQSPAKSYPLELTENSANSVKGHFEGEDINLTEDLVFAYDLDPSSADTLRVITFRSPVAGQPSPTETSPARPTQQPGFFEAEALLGINRTSMRGAEARSADARTVIVLFDTSLSMQWEKLERSYQAFESLLRTLRPVDQLAIVLFNSETQVFPLNAATPANIQQAIGFVRSSRLRGGTDLQHALAAGLEQAELPVAKNIYLVILSDGGATRGAIQNNKLASWYASRWKQLSDKQRPHTYILAIGDDANLPLLRMLIEQDGVLEQVLSTEPLTFKLEFFLAKVGRSPIGEPNLEVVPSGAVDSVYPLQVTTFAGSTAAWVGRYQLAQERVAFKVNGVRDGAKLELTAESKLPAESSDHSQLPRLWARARVDSLLAKIEREGEDQASIDEIIRLAREYKFVTPYTSFLAVPRALLRPRVIRPGDPILRVKTDESIVSVIALFPFGLVQPLRHLSGEDIWQTRFLAPSDLEDGTYTVRLILRDRLGHTYRESKTFVIASKPPVVEVRLDSRRLEGAPLVDLRWDSRVGVNTGELVIPQNMIAGKYKLTVTAEDIAHNIGSKEVEIEVLP